MTEIKKDVEAQGVKKQAISKTYTLTQFGEMIKKLKELKWIDEKEEKLLTEIREKAKQEYIKSL